MFIPTKYKVPRKFRQNYSCSTFNVVDFNMSNCLQWTVPNACFFLIHFVVSSLFVEREINYVMSIISIWFTHFRSEIHFFVLFPVWRKNHFNAFLALFYAKKLRCMANECNQITSLMEMKTFPNANVVVSN